jgi:hypothetical protein
MTVEVDDLGRRAGDTQDQVKGQFVAETTNVVSRGRVRARLARRFEFGSKLAGHPGHQFAQLHHQASQIDDEVADRVRATGVAEDVTPARGAHLGHGLVPVAVQDEEGVGQHPEHRGEDDLVSHTGV